MTLASARRSGDQRDFVSVGDTIGAGKLKVAAHQQGGVLVDGLPDTRAYRTDTGNQRGADREAGDDQGKAAPVTAHIQQTERGWRPRDGASGGRSGFDQLAHRHGEHAIGARGEAGIVGDHHHRRALLARHVEHQLDNAGAGLLVEIAGRLVGQQQSRLARSWRGRDRRAAVRRPRALPADGAADHPARRTSSARQRRSPDLGQRQLAGEAISSASPTLSRAVSEGMR